MNPWATTTGRGISGCYDKIFQIFSGVSGVSM